MGSWLKKYGLKILQVGAQVLGIAGTFTQQYAAASPFVSKVNSGIDVADEVISGIQTIETTFGAAFGTAKTGPAKIAALQPIVQQAIQLYLKENFPGTAHIANQSLFTQGCGEIGQGFVDVMNSLGNDVTTTQTVTVAGPAAPLPVPSPVPAITPTSTSNSSTS
jgi:hypothetical protein